MDSIEWRKLGTNVVEPYEPIQKGHPRGIDCKNYPRQLRAYRLERAVWLRAQGLSFIEIAEVIHGIAGQPIGRNTARNYVIDGLRELYRLNYWGCPNWPFIVAVRRGCKLADTQFREKHAATIDAILKLPRMV